MGVRDPVLTRSPLEPDEGRTGTRVFTGIIEELGEVVDLDRLADSARLTVRGRRVVADTRPGDSIAVDGCCLTVVDLEPDDGRCTVDVMAETLERTTLGTLRLGQRVNLERAVRADGRLGGHLVQGHIDGTGQIRRREHTPRWDLLEVAIPARLCRYVAEKGSIAVDGVSLTVVEVRDHPEPAFTVSLIPTTLALTTLGHKQPGDAVNLEVDVLAKYVERLLTTSRTPDAVPAVAAEGVRA
ncbi:riboflavin synthase alpha chain [Thermasporomyces composti]|uniref:Riboflavin synthase n=1 Tax=Thermasporomyces composti TaxID=696763 RepID=A0A3D9VDS5_THECX|nr:riboflavin synthase alpha chain [Thermasporomyces composti]